MDNITIRKKMRRSHSETNLSLPNSSSDVLNSTFLDSTMISLRSEPQNNVNNSMNEMISELEILKERLISADIEVDNLSSENIQLKHTIQEQAKQIELLKQLTRELPSKTNVYKATTPGNNRLLNIKIRTPRMSPLQLAKSACASLYNSPTKTQKQNPEPNTVNNQFETIVAHNSASSQVNQKNNKTATPNYITQESCTNSTTNHIKHRVIIIADNQGRNLRHNLQQLLGTTYQVVSFIKPNATLGEVILSMQEEIKGLTMDDYVIMLAGSNDKNPYTFSSKLDTWLSSVPNTNIITGEISRNDYLCESKLNYEMKFICSKYKNVVYTDLDYSRIIPYHNMFALHLARSLLREILCIFYHSNMEKHILSRKEKIREKSYKNVSTQTSSEIADLLNCNVCNKPDNIDNSNNSNPNNCTNNNDNFFRV